ncbi:MAG: type II toxin-antitoxin system VapC family toxin [Kiritimatiellaeota bacterium]|nr:type II toxin-antitoxin system VapC family toxin [Kiritimatiellota bacterium]
MKSVYIETSIVSYLTARPARDLLAAAWQTATSRWWEGQRKRFALYTSQLVVAEAQQGDAAAAQRRLHALQGIPHLALPDPVTALAEELISQGALPESAADDALHLALAAYHGMDYLLTWNCRHLDTAEMKALMRSVCALKGYGRRP